MKTTFSIDRSPDFNPVFIIGIDGTFLDYNFSIEDIKALKNVLNEAIREYDAQKPKIVFHEQLRGNILKPDLENADPSSPLFNKRTVITGVFNHFSRDELASKLRKMGADLNGSVSKKTDFVIVGDEAGPMKLQKIKQLNEENANIVILKEPEVLSIIKAYNEFHL
jgi:NAD-dependent DNA ligase